MNNNLVYRGMKYFWYLFVCNLAFLMGNGVLVFSLLNIKFTSLGLLFYLIGAILLFPNLLALFATVRGVFLKKRENHLIRRYFSSLKENMLEGLKVAPVYLGLLIVCLTNLVFLGQNKLNGFSPFFLVLIILLALHLLIFMIVKAELIIGNKEAMKLSFYLISKHGICGLVSVLLLFIAATLVMMVPQYFTLFGFSALAGASTLLYRVPIKEAVATISGKDKQRERELMRQLL